MITKHLTAALIGSTLMIAPAMAQSTSANNSNSNSQQVNASSTGDWQASQLIKLNVYNNNNEKIGDIKELMMNKDGKIDQAVIGVGGCLGIGERDVAVKFSDLKFSDQPVKSSSNTGNATSSTSGAGTASSSSSSQNTTMTGSAKNYPDHAVLNMTKDQLQSMPQFNYNK